MPISIIYGKNLVAFKRKGIDCGEFKLCEQHNEYALVILYLGTISAFNWKPKETKKTCVEIFTFNSTCILYQMKKEPTNALYLLIQLFILLFPYMFRRSKTPSWGFFIWYKMHGELKVKLLKEAFKQNDCDQS
jgi:hypothetical protein